LQGNSVSAMRCPVVLLPGIIAPAAIRYGPLVERLTDVDVVVRDLAVYDDDEPPADFSIDTELVALDRAADDAGLERFHLYGHSGGGAVALAYAASRGHRVQSLAVDEPASDMTDEGDAVYGWAEFDEAALLPPAESMAAFMRLQVAEDVILPSPPGGDPPPWMVKRPAGIRAFVAALRRHRVEPAEYSAFAAPVYFSRGSRTHPRWEAMQTRLAALFPDFTGDVFEGLHHLNTSHQAEPDRVAATLTAFWKRSETGAESAVASARPGLRRRGQPDGCGWSVVPAATSQYPSPTDGRAIPTASLPAGRSPLIDPKYGAFPNANTPPSRATSQ
jgi:pimeloyl-ACP methyl ester carboxylesterase